MRQVRGAEIQEHGPAPGPCAQSRRGCSRPPPAMGTFLRSSTVATPFIYVEGSDTHRPGLCFCNQAMLRTQAHSQAHTQQEGRQCEHIPLPETRKNNEPDRSAHPKAQRAMQRATLHLDAQAPAVCKVCSPLQQQAVGAHHHAPARACGSNQSINQSSQLQSVSTALGCCVRPGAACQSKVVRDCEETAHQNPRQQ